MTEFGTALLGSVQKSFAGYLMTDKDLARLSNRVRDGTDYEAANEYAARVGELLAKSIDDNTKTLAFMSRDVAQEVLTPLLTENHEIVAQAAATVQKNMNDAAGIGMGVLTADLDTNRINGLIDKVSSYDTYEQAKWVLNEPVVNYSQAVVDQTIRKNAQAHYKAGFEPIVIRKTEAAGTKTRFRKIKGRSYKYTYAVPCKWCAGLEGVYKYSEVKNTGNDVFRRHEACRCIIIYKDANKTINVRTQHTWTGEDAQQIANKILGIETAAQPTDRKQYIADTTRTLQEIGIKNVDQKLFKNVPQELLTANVEQLKRLEDRFNVMHRSKGTGLLYNGRISATARTSSLLSDPSIQWFELGKDYKNIDAFIRQELRWQATGYSMPFDTSSRYEALTFTITHEYGHALQNLMYYQAKLNGYTGSDLEWTRQAIAEICKIAGETNPDFEFVKQMSEYGKTNAWESFAESFANSQMGKPNAMGKAMNVWLKRKGY